MPRVNQKIRQLIVDSIPNEKGLVKILQFIIQHHREAADGVVRLKPHFSIYRDILFVALDQFGKNVDREQFDREFQIQVERLPARVVQLLQKGDYLPQLTAVACRRLFLPLDLN
ncbi:unnamed protein product [Bursaphelenchus okinawaensis]|uniref:Uncharacterized protein n=1 Tax=Bursaphelenchus okinawaensis TaxID=465554 RepID=A0A811KTY8_9BILA|nr:unnamed protein product [Bursaphelenchus okinawaensis]CAG9111706.1 unnamed protein product [Bursaphelenchus okinawaensis]